MAWMTNYLPEERKTFDVADGDHKVKVLKVENKVSKSGLNMHELTYSVEGSNGELFIDRICEGDYYNAAMTRWFDAFKIPRGNYDFSKWIGRVAYAHFEHKAQEYTDQNGNKKTSNRPNLIYFHNNVPEAPAQTMSEKDVQGLANAFGGTAQKADIF